MLLWSLLYLCGALVTAVGASFATNRVSERKEPLPRRGLIALAGVLWPVIIVGLVQLITIAAIAKMMGLMGVCDELASPVTTHEAVLTARLRPHRRTHL
jgi:hypothetical protein